MDRLERLVNLVAALLDARRPLTREELRERVGGYSPDDEAFRRNFERDKDALRRMGMPLVMVPVEGDAPDAPSGYRVPRDRYELPDLGLTEEELAALRLAVSAVEIQGGQGAAASAIRKLAGGSVPRPATSEDRSGTAAGPGGEAQPAPPGVERPGVERPGVERPGVERPGTRSPGTGAQGMGAPAVGPGPAPVAEVPGGDAVAVAFGAISERQRLELTYRGRRRTIDPWRLTYRRGLWYLSGWDHGPQAQRVFRLDRAEGPVRLAGEPGAFTRPPGAGAAPPPPWRLGDEPETVVRVLVDEVVAPTAIAAAGEAAGEEAVVVERRADGSVVLELVVTSTPALHSFVLGFLDRAEILSPPEVRAGFVGALAALAAPAGSR